MVAEKVAEIVNFAKEKGIPVYQMNINIESIAYDLNYFQITEIE